jgi:hypothetical protein
MGGRKLGAYSILITMLSGLVSWLFAVARYEIPEIKINQASNIQNIKSNKENIHLIREDLIELRKGQREILEILIKR